MLLHQTTPQRLKSNSENNCLINMQSNDSLHLTMPYHIEEYKILHNHFSQASSKKPYTNFVGIGCGNLRYADVALNFCSNYIAIDSMLNEQLDTKCQKYLSNISKIHILQKDFEQVSSKEIPEGRTLYFYLFNVFPYIKNAWDIQKTLMRPGDAVLISAWNNKDFQAMALQK